MARGRGVARPLILLACLGTLSCVDTIGPQGPDFGVGYNIVLEPNAPVLDSSGVTLTVTYSGCSDNKEFQVWYRVVGTSMAEVWLHRVSPHEPCDLFIEERRTFAVPLTVQAADGVVLLGPNIEPYVLRAF